MQSLIPLKGTKTPEKWLIPGLRRRYRNDLKYLVLPELKKKKTIKDSELDETK